MTVGNITSTPILVTSAPEPDKTNWTGIRFLLFLIYGFIAFILMLFFIKRAILRARHSLRFPHQLTTPGAGTTKKLINEIDKELDNAMNLMYEPKLTTADERTRQGTNPCNYIYRMKAVDAFSDLDEVFADVNEDLARPMGKDMRQHLLDVKSHSSGCLRSIRTTQLEIMSDLYMKARFGPETFTSHEYERLVELISEVISTLRLRHRKKQKTKKIGSHHPSTSQGTDRHSSDKTPYTTTSLSPTEACPSPSSRSLQSQDMQPLLI